MTRPSNDAIAQAFWDAHEDFAGTTPRGMSRWIQQRARDIDAANPSFGTLDSITSKTFQSEWVIVPREPTDAMLDACDEIEVGRDDFGSAYRMSWGMAGEAYKAMIAAAPTPPKHEAVAEVVANAPHLDSTHVPMNELRWNLSDAEDALPIGTKLYAAQPAPTTDDDVRRDAQRYRWLRDRASKDEGNIVFELAGAYDDFGMSEEGIDSAIDAAIREASGVSNGD